MQITIANISCWQEKTMHFIASLYLALKRIKVYKQKKDVFKILFIICLSKNGCIHQYSNTFSHGTRIPRERAAGIAAPYNTYSFLSFSNEENSWENEDYCISFFRCYQNLLKATMLLISNYISYSSSWCSTMNTIPFQNKTSSFKAWALSVSNNTMPIAATGKSNYYFLSLQRAPVHYYFDFII